MSATAYRVHLDRGNGRSCCGRQQDVPVTRDEDEVTCGVCLNLLNGTHGAQVKHPSGYQWADVKPCGTHAAYQRHRRRDGAPVRCETCLQGERRRTGDRKRDLRRAA